MRGTVLAGPCRRCCNKSMYACTFLILVEFPSPDVIFNNMLIKIAGETFIHSEVAMVLCLVSLFLITNFSVGKV